MVRLSIGLLALASSIFSIAHGAGNSDWRSRTIYQVMTDRFAHSDGSTTAPCNTPDGTYCGGTWKGIKNQLDYIQGMGFDAIWISPVTAQLQGNTPDGSAYHGYWQQDIYSVNSNFGTAQDLKDLSAEIHKRGMYLMVDIVTNHMAFHATPDAINYQTLRPFNHDSYYHNFCEINYDNIADLKQIQQCWMGDKIVPLVDLRTEDPQILAEFQDWITQMVSNYTIDGLRVDSTMQVDKEFWQPFLKSAGVYAVGEVYHDNSTFVCGYQDFLPGVMNYGTYFPLISAFQSTSGNMGNLANAIKAVTKLCSDASLLGTFSENHDQPRFAQLNSDMSEAMNVVAFTVLADGIPIIYQGQEQHYASTGGSGVPYNREALWLSGFNTNAPLYTMLKSLNAARKNAMTQDSSYLTAANTPIYTDSNTIAMRKGDMLTVLSNKGSSGNSYTLSIDSKYPSNTGLTELLTCKTITTDGSGKLGVPMANGLPRVYYPTSALSGSGLCGATSGGQGTTQKSTSTVPPNLTAIEAMDLSKSILKGLGVKQ